MSKQAFMAEQQQTSGAGGEAPEPFIGKAETARRLSRGVRTLENWMHRGIVPFYKPDKAVMFRWSEVQAAVARYRHGNR